MSGKMHCSMCVSAGCIEARGASGPWLESSRLEEVRFPLSLLQLFVSKTPEARVGRTVPVAKNSESEASVFQCLERHTQGLMSRDNGLGFGGIRFRV